MTPIHCFCSTCEQKTPCILAYETTYSMAEWGRKRPYILCTRCGHEIDLTVEPWEYALA